MVFDVCVSLLRDTSAKRIACQTHTPLRRLRTLQHMLRLFESRHSFLQCRWFEVLDNYDSFVLFIQSYSYMCINIYICMFHVCVYIYVCIYICKVYNVYVYIYITHSIYIYITYYGGFLKWGTPESSILIRFSIINHPFCGTPICGKPPYI